MQLPDLLGVMLEMRLSWLQIALPWSMAAFIYRCPTTGRNVQGWFADDVSED